MSTINIDTVVNNQNPRTIKLLVTEHQFVGNSSLRNKLSWLFGSIFNRGAIRCQKDKHTVGWISRDDFNNWINSSFQENIFRGLDPRTIIQHIRDNTVPEAIPPKASKEQKKIESGQASKETYYNLAMEDDQDPQMVFSYLKKAADLGYPPAQYELAKIYDGRKSARNLDDYRLAQQYYEYAVNGGYEEAEVPLAEILIDPVNPDCFDRGKRELAAKLFDKHVLTNPQAAFRLGLMHKIGIPMGQKYIDLDLAAHYLAIAQTLGHKDAQNELNNLRKKK